MLRHHRLLERYLVDRLGLSLADVHAEAELLEHALSEELEAKIDAELGYPTHDPHGDPIPDSELRVTHGLQGTLIDLEPGDLATISRIPDGDPELLRYLGELGLVPGSEVELVAFAPFGGRSRYEPTRASTRSRASSPTASPRRRSVSPRSAPRP